MSRKKKIALALLMIAMTLLCLFACEKKEESPTVEENREKMQVRTVSLSSDIDIGAAIASKGVVADRTEEDDYDEENTLSSELCYVYLREGESRCVDKNGDPLPYDTATVAGNTVVINKIGTYVVSGKLENGRIILSSADKIQLVCKGVDLHCANAPALETYGSGKKILTMAQGTENFFSDGKEERGYENKTAVLSRGVLLINGRGALTVCGEYDGITAPGIKIKDVELIVEAGEKGICSAAYLFANGTDVTMRTAGRTIEATDEISVKESTLSLRGKEMYGRDILTENVVVAISGDGDGLVSERVFWARKSQFGISVRGDGVVAKEDAGIVRFADCTAVISDGDDGVRAGYFSFLSGAILCYGMGTQLNVTHGIEASSALQEAITYEILPQGKTVEVGEISTVFDREWRTFVYAGKRTDGFLYLNGEKYALLW